MDDFYTVKTLRQTLEKLEKQGLSDKIIVVPKDDEGNGYRPLPKQGILIKEKEIDEYVDFYEDDCEKTYTDNSLKANTFIVL